MLMKVGTKVIIKYNIIRVLNTDKKELYNLRLPKFITWILSTCEFDFTDIGEIVKINSTGKLLVKFNKPVFQNHPNKMDKDGYSAYLIKDVLYTFEQLKLTLQYEILDNTKKYWREVYQNII